jgi:lipoate-protein ligase A
MAEMSQYLNVSAEKLRSKSVESVRSRVVNLKELNHEIDLPKMKSSLIRAFGTVYGVESHEIFDNDLNRDILSTLVDKYASNEWIFGDHMKADYTFSGSFPWGEIEINLQILGDKISDVKVFTDSLDIDISDVLSKYLTGVTFRGENILTAVAKAGKETIEEVAYDLKALFESQEIWMEEKSL